MNNMSMQLAANLALTKAAGCMQKSAEVMGVMNDMMKVGEMSKEMHAFAREMEKAGLIEEMINDGECPFLPGPDTVRLGTLHDPSPPPPPPPPPSLPGGLP